MDIFIYQAGEQLGPFTETQVRQYLRAGMIALSDLAIAQGMERWQPLATVLVMLPPPEDELGELIPDQPVQPLTTSAHQSLEYRERSSALTLSRPISLPTTASQKTKRKQNKIVIQPIQPLQTTALIPQPRKKARTGKTAVMIEPPRPTTALPPVSGFARKEMTNRRPVRRVESSTLPLLSQKPEAPPVSPVTTSPTPPEIPSVSVRPALKDSQFLSPASLLPEKTKDPVEPSQGAEMSRPLILIGAGAVLLVFATIASACLLFLHNRNDSAPHMDKTLRLGEPAHATPESSSTVATPHSAADYSNRGFIRQSNGDLDGALSDYNTALNLDPKNFAASFRRGLALETRGDWNGALSDYNTVLEIDPQNLDAFSNRGFVKQSLGDLDGALKDYEAALRLNPKISKAYYNEGLIEVQKGALDKAISAFDQCVALDPQMALAYYNRAGAKMIEGDLDGAFKDYSQALTINPKIARAYSDRGSVRQAKGDLDGALADYTQALALDPAQSTTCFRRGSIELLKGEFEAVIADNSQAINLDPKNAPAYFNRAMGLIGQSRFTDASADLTRFLSLAPQDSGADTARIYLWMADTKQNPQGNADQQLSTALLGHWNATPEDFISKVASFLLGHLKERELVANAASPDARIEPGQYCKAWYFAGMKRLLNGDTTTALQYFQKCTATNQRTQPEFIFAQAELQALGQNREVASKPVSGPQ